MRRNIFFIAFIIALSTILNSCNTHAPDTLEDATDKKIVCLFFDDGWQNQYDVALPILLQHGFHATFSIIINVINTGQGNFRYFDEEAIRTLDGYNMDIACHSRKHMNLTDNLTDEQLYDEIVRSKKELEVLDTDVRTFVYPYDAWDGVVHYVKEAGYICARAGPSPRAYHLSESDLENERYHLKSCMIYDQSLDEYKQILSSVKPGGMVILTYHHISDLIDKYNTPVADFAAQMRYLQQSGYQVIPLPDVVSQHLSQGTSGRK